MRLLPFYRLGTTTYIDLFVIVNVWTQPIPQLLWGTHISKIEEPDTTNVPVCTNQ
jgi:hypothetical protein